MKHILSTIKMCELIDGRYCMALDLMDQNECHVFLFTDSYANDVNFVIHEKNIKINYIDEE
jgi:hypothetical protein